MCRRRRGMRGSGELSLFMLGGARAEAGEKSSAADPEPSELPSALAQISTMPALIINFGLSTVTVALERVYTDRHENEPSYVVNLPITRGAASVEMKVLYVGRSRGPGLTLKNEDFARQAPPLR